MLPLLFFDNAAVCGSDHWSLMVNHLEYLRIYLQHKISADDLATAGVVYLSVWRRFGEIYGREYYRPKAHFGTHLATTPLR